MQHKLYQKHILFAKTQIDDPKTDIINLVSLFISDSNRI